MLAHHFTEPRKNGITYTHDSGRLVGDQWVFERVDTDYAVNPTGWWLSPKIDGVRASWNPEKGFLSRSGKPLNIPKDYIRCVLPKGMSLDGELLIPNTSAAYTSGQLHSKAGNLDRLTYYVFDIIGYDAIYAERYALLKTMLCDHVVVLPQIPIENMDHAHELYRDLIVSGGEGVIIRDPTAYYEPKRSWSMLKWKPTLTDEAIVVGFEEGKGRLKGKLGNFIVVYKDKQFKLSGKLSDAFRSRYHFKNKHVNYDHHDNDTVQLGDMVTFEYMELSEYGIPRQPVFIGKRFDL